MANIYIQDYEWSKSKKRSIDDETLCDFLRIIEYQADRSTILEDAGFEDKGAPDEALFTYVLDALDVPPNGHVKDLQGEHKAFSKACMFSRDWFDELFYSEFLLCNSEHNWTYQDVLELIRSEINNNLLNHYQ